MQFSDQKLLGVPIVLQPSQAEKNRLENYAGPMIRPEKGPMKLYVGNLHCNISDEMLRSKGYVFITYMEAEDVKKAMKHLNGFELADKNMEVGLVAEQHANNSLEQDDGCARFDLGAKGRLALMAKLAEGTGMKVPESARNGHYGVQEASASKVNVAGGGVRQPAAAEQSNLPPIATQCFMLSNMSCSIQSTSGSPTVTRRSAITSSTSVTSTGE